MKVIITHASPDWDAITSVWLLKRFLPGWENAKVAFVPAGQRYKNMALKADNAIEILGEEEIIHVDTGLGPLDHHQTSDKNTCAASLCWEYVKPHVVHGPTASSEERYEQKKAAIDRIVKIVVSVDHFQEVFWANPAADYHEFSLLGLLEGIKIQNPGQDDYYVDFGMICLDAEVHNFENRIWAEKEIAAHGKEFTTRYGPGIGFDSMNDTVIKLSQKKGFVIVIRKDPRKGYVRIKVRPSTSEKDDINLTKISEQLRKMDPEATWFLHVSKKMLLNGTPKNPKMIPSKLTLDQIIKVVETI